MSTSLAVVRAENEELSAISRLVLDAVGSERTRRDYARALSDFLEWYIAESPGALTKATVQAHVRHLREIGVPASSINQRLAAIRKLALEAADNNLIDEAAAQAIKRVPNIPHRGEKTGNWMTLAQAQAMLDAPDISTRVGLRDRAMLAVLIGCGLRREEVVRLAVNHLHMRENRWVILNLVGKHGRTRTVPMADWIKAYIDAWTTEAGIAAGAIFRRIFKNGKIGKALSSQAVWLVVQRYNPVPDKLAPHDLRRTFAVLAEEGGANVRDIQRSLGHASLNTTEVYLGQRRNLRDAPSDRLGIQKRESEQ